ncbi:MAG: hypothetical protein VKK59_06145 [Vampirovibrionales bacterium]|nr:hypothetical protein [Vampirovibrionales bacterium]
MVLHAQKIYMGGVGLTLCRLHRPAAMASDHGVEVSHALNGFAQVRHDAWV